MDKMHKLLPLVLSVQCWQCTADTDCVCSAVVGWGHYRQASPWSQLGQVTITARIFTRDQTQHSQY